MACQDIEKQKSKKIGRMEKKKTSLRFEELDIWECLRALESAGATIKRGTCMSIRGDGSQWNAAVLYMR